MLMKITQELIKSLTAKKFANYLDSTLLKVDVSTDTALRYIEDAREYGFKCVVLSPYHALYVLTKRLAEDVPICSVVGFPMGFTPTKIKVMEAEELLVKGVAELDIVMNIQAFKNGLYDDVLDDLIAVVDVARRYGAVSKVIIESPMLSFVEKVKAINLVVEAKADFVKTSTGILAKTSLQDVYTLAKIANGRIKVKAAGGFRNAIDTLIAITFGAERIGTSTATQIYKEFIELQKMFMDDEVSRPISSRQEG